MKVFRIGVLTLLLLAGATSGPLPTGDITSPRATPMLAAAADGPCYLINGIWVCDP